MSSKRILIGLLTLTLSTIVFLSGYLFSRSGFLSGGSAEIGSMLARFDNNATKATTISLDSNSGQAVVSRKVNSVVPSKNHNSILYYEKATGRAFELDLSTKKESPLSLVNLPNFLSTVWSPTQEEVVSSFYDPSGSIYKYFSYKTKKSIPLPKGVQSITFSPDGRNLAYFLIGDESNYVYISSPDGSSPKKILSTRVANASLAWPSADLIILKSVDENTGATTLLGVNTKGEILPILSSASESSELWSKDGKKMMHSQVNEPESKVVDIKTGLAVSTELDSRPSSCAWSVDNRTIYCIGSSSQGDTGQRLYRVNAEDGKTADIGVVPDHIKPKEAQLSLLEDYLVVLNDIDEKLYVVPTAE